MEALSRVFFLLSVSCFGVGEIEQMTPLLRLSEVENVTLDSLIAGIC